MDDNEIAIMMEIHDLLKELLISIRELLKILSSKNPKDTDSNTR